MPAIALRSIDTLRGPSAADLVFGELYGGSSSGDLPPGARLSEPDVARQMGVSRQPVRDAFYRLSKLGLVQSGRSGPRSSPHLRGGGAPGAVHPHRARDRDRARRGRRPRPTRPSPSSTRTARRRRRRAVAADDRMRFHALDDEFHEAICAASGHDFAWALIRENKAHMDRVRWLSLAFGAQARSRTTSASSPRCATAIPTPPPTRCAPTSAASSTFSPRSAASIRRCSRPNAPELAAWPGPARPRGPVLGCNLQPAD